MKDKKTMDNMPIFREVLDVFPKDFLGVPPEIQVGFRLI